MTPDGPPRLTTDSPLEDVDAYLRALQEEVEDLDPIARATAREQAVRDLSDIEAVSSPARMVDAALASARDDTESDPGGDDVELPDELRRAAGQRLERDDLLDEALETMRDRGLVEEGTNARLLYLAGVGGALDAPIHVVVHGASAAGKNNLARRAFELLPPRYVLSVSGLSEHALEYRGGRIEGVLLVDEAEGQGQAEYGLRVAMSEGRLTRLTVNKGEDGRNRAEELEVEVAASVVTTTTAPAIHAENQTRVFDLYVDEGEEVTQEVLARRAREAAGTADVASEDDLGIWRAVVEMLEPADVVIPWAERLAEGFPTGAVRARRDFPRVLALVEASALLHQRQRPRDDAGRVVATADDWEAVYPLVQEVLGPSMTGINEVARKLCELHDELVADRATAWLRRPDLEEAAGERDIASRNTVHKWCKRLSDLGVWEGRREAGKAWEHRRLRDVVEEPIPLPTPEEISQGVPTLPMPPNSGGGRRSSESDRGSDGGPNPPNEIQTEGGEGETPPSGRDSGSDWEGPVSPSETGPKPPSHGGSGGLGGVGGPTCPECGEPMDEGRELCEECRALELDSLFGGAS